jgi:transcription initiation factor IIE alpha subunit
MYSFLDFAQQRDWVRRGIGKTQQAVLDELSAGRIAVTELVERLGVGDRQTRRAVHALADGGLINLYKVTRQLPNGSFTPVELFVEKPGSHPRSSAVKESAARIPESTWWFSRGCPTAE